MSEGPRLVCRFECLMAMVLSYYFLFLLPCRGAVVVEIIQLAGNPENCGTRSNYHLSLTSYGSVDEPKLTFSASIDGLKSGVSFGIRSRRGLLEHLACDSQYQASGCKVFDKSHSLAEGSNRPLLADIMVGRAQVIVSRGSLPPCIFQIAAVDSIVPVAISRLTSANGVEGELRYSFSHTVCAPEITAEWRGDQKATPSELILTMGSHTCTYNGVPGRSDRMRLIDHSSNSNYSLHSPGHDPSIKSFRLQLGEKSLYMVLAK